MKKFSRIISAMLAGTFALGALSGCNKSEIQVVEGKEVVRILAPSGSVPQDIINVFQEESGYQLMFNSYSGSDDLFSYLDAYSDYDLVLTSDYAFAKAVNDGYAKKLKKTKIKNFDNIDENYLGQYYDPDSNYIVPYAAGSAVIVYDSSKIDIDITSCADLWDSSLSGKLALLDSSRNIIGMTLQSMGKSVNETDTAALDEAASKFTELVPNILEVTTTPQSLLISGDADIAYMLSPQAVLALAERPELTVVYPEEGLTTSIDGWFIANNAPNTDGAYAFLNYILDGENSAAISEAINCRSVNSAAEEYLSEGFTSNTAIYPPEDAADAELIRYDIDDDTAAKYTEIWTAFKELVDPTEEEDTADDTSDEVTDSTSEETAQDSAADTTEE